MDSREMEMKLARFGAVSAVLAKVTAGMKMSAAIAEVSKLAFRANGREVRAKRRTLYRWVAAYQSKGFAGLGYEPRLSSEPSRVLDEKFISFLKDTKEQDPKTSVPDVMRAAVILGMAKEGEHSRTSVWRAARRLNLALMGTQAKTCSVKCRFEYPHRMQMVLCDGKHFRAGLTQSRRVVFCFLDDSTRKILVTVVGESESKVLFLKGLHKVILRYGKMQTLYLDNGAGFIALDVEVICARLGIKLIHGTAGYPEGHGKIERFNQTLGKDLLRSFAGDPSVDANLKSLEMRTEHYTREIYNKQKHEGIDNISPDEKWSNDTLGFDVVDDIQKIESHFVVSEMRKVSNDNIVMLDGVAYEMPLGYAGKRAIVNQDFIYGTVSVLHLGKRVSIVPVNLALNAASRRARAAEMPEPLTPANTAARIAFKKDFDPVVSPTGDFHDNDE